MSQPYLPSLSSAWPPPGERSIALVFNPGYLPTLPNRHFWSRLGYFNPWGYNPWIRLISPHFDSPNLTAAKRTIRPSSTDTDYSASFRPCFFLARREFICSISPLLLRISRRGFPFSRNSRRAPYF